MDGLRWADEQLRYGDNGVENAEGSALDNVHRIQGKGLRAAGPRRNDAMPRLM
jgi:hypothetical protein